MIVTNKGNQTSYRTWFHFRIQGFEPDQLYTFTLYNMSGKGDLYSSGLKPVYKVIPGDEKWNTIPNQVNTEIIEESLRVQFSYLFD